MLTALDVLGYERPTQLRGERARLIGLVLPELQNPIFPALAEVVGGALAQRGFTPVLCTRTTGGLSEADYVGMLLDQQVSGVVFAGGHYAELAAPHDHYRLLRSRGIPAVLINAAIDDLDFPRVSTDDVTAADQAYTHLASLGHQRIGLVLGPEDHMPSRRKLAAFAAHAAAAPGRGEQPRWSTRCSPWRAARPPPPGCCGTASPASSAPATCWPSARSGPSGARACPCPGTSRWSATTTPRS